MYLASAFTLEPLSARLLVERVGAGTADVLGSGFIIRWCRGVLNESTSINGVCIKV